MGRRSRVLDMERRSRALNIHAYDDILLDRRPMMMMMNMKMKMKKKTTNTQRRHSSSHMPIFHPIPKPSPDLQQLQKMRLHNHQMLLQQAYCSGRKAMARLPGSKSLKKCKGQRKKGSRFTTELLHEWHPSSSLAASSSSSSSAETELDPSLVSSLHDSLLMLIIPPALLPSDVRLHDQPSPSPSPSPSSSSPSSPRSDGDRSIISYTDDWLDLGSEFNDLSDANIDLLLFASTHSTPSLADDASDRDAEWFLC